MKQIGSLAAICAALLFVSLCVGLMTAGPAIAQSGTGKDVRVVNTTAEAIPTTITNVPAVQVSGTPTVNVGNTPNVNVLSVPAVQVGNSAGNPVPVTITNLPAAQAPGVPLTFHGSINMTANVLGQGVPLTTVPAGKRLMIDYVTYRVFDDFDVSHFALVGISAGPSGPPFPRCYVAVDGRAGRVESASEHVVLSGPAGYTVEFRMERDSADGPAFVEYSVVGHLVDVP